MSIATTLEAGVLNTFQELGTSWNMAIHLSLTIHLQDTDWLQVVSHLSQIPGTHTGECTNCICPLWLWRCTSKG